MTEDNPYRPTRLNDAPTEAQYLETKKADPE